MLKCHYSTVWSMKTVAVLTADRAFALFLRPHPEGFDTQESQTPGICHSRQKNANAWGSVRVRGGAGGGVALGAQVAQAYYESSEQHYPT